METAACAESFQPEESGTGMSQPEIESVRAELEAFVSQAVPQYCSRLQLLIQNVAGCLDGQFNAQQAEGNPSLQFGDTTLFDSAQSSFKGGFTLRKQQIVKANMELRFKKYLRGQPLKSTIGTPAVYLVPQLQNSRNYCELALEELLEIMSWPRLNCVSVSKLADTLWQYLSQAIQELLYPARYAFPQSFHSSTVFDPALPPDLAVDFYVRDGAFVVSATTFSQCNQSSSKAEGTPGSAPQLVYKHNVVEVQEQIECVFQMNELDRAMKLLQTARQLCTHLKDQLSALNACT